MPTPPTIVTFAASAATINAGDSVEIDWSVTGADSGVYIDQIGTVPLNGKATITPIRTFVYTLTASDSKGGSSMATLTVTVTVVPSPVILCQGCGYYDRIYPVEGQGLCHRNPPKDLVSDNWWCSFATVVPVQDLITNITGIAVRVL